MQQTYLYPYLRRHFQNIVTYSSGFIDIWMINRCYKFDNWWFERISCWYCQVNFKCSLFIWCIFWTEKICFCLFCFFLYKFIVIAVIVIIIVIIIVIVVVNALICIITLSVMLLLVLSFRVSSML